MKNYFLCLTVALVCLAGCAEAPTQSMPKPTVTDYFQTIGGGFISNGKSLMYAVDFNIRKPLNGSKSWFATVEFENPENSSSPLIQMNEYKPDQKNISINSAELYSIGNHRTYKVNVKAYSDSLRTNLIATHDMFVRFDLPDSMAASFGVKILN